MITNSNAKVKRLLYTVKRNLFIIYSTVFNLFVI